ncbi:MAG: hypothetical protein IT583_00885 [Verrucomicrobia bacterium]|nr:hypothetical protein [Verrucomicrobiota bacterium]
MFTRYPKKLFAFTLALFAATMLSAAELKFYAPFDEGEGSVTQDKAGQLEGKVAGAVWVDGKAGKALQFDGKDKADGVTAANVVFGIKGADNFLHNFGGGAFSVTAWIKPDSTKPYTKGNEILNTGSDKGPGWRFYYFWRSLYFRSGDGTAFWEAVSNPANDKINNDEWNHVAVTRNAAGIETLYINGKKAAETSALENITKGAAGRLTIGAYGGGAAYGFKGIIDEVKIYSGELTAEEIYKETSSASSIRKSAITLDGRLDEEIWGKATVFDSFVVNGSVGGAPSKVRTKGMIAYDNEFIYAAFVCDEPDMASLKKNASENGMAVYRDDCVELMLDSDNNRGDYYHILCNPLGSYGVTFQTQAGMVGSVVPVFRCLTGAEIGKDKWTVEMAIPFSSITLDQVKNTVAVNMTRTRRTNLTKVEESSICKDGAFHKPVLFSQMELTGADLSPYALEVKYPSVGDVGFKGKAIQAVVKTSVKNPTAKSRKLSIMVAEDKAGSIASFELTMAPNEEKEISANLPIEKSGVFNVTYNIKEGGKLVFDSTYSVKIEDVSPLSVEITKPFFRNTIFATQKADEIAGTTTLRLSPAEFAGSTAEVSFNDKDGKSTASAKSPLTSAVQKFSIPLPANLPAGTYTLVAKVVKDGKSLAEQKTPILIATPAKGSEVRLAQISDDVVMVIGGKPTFPIWWWGGSSYDEMAKTGGDGVIIQVTSSAGVAELDKLQQAKQYGIVSFSTSSNAKKLFQDQSTLSKESKEYLVAMVNLVKDHPALLCYYLNDEPEVRAIDTRLLEEACKLIREIDPNHPVAICNDTVEGIHNYKNAQEVFIPDPYVCPRTDGTLTKPLTYIATFMDNAMRAGEGKKLVGNTPQIFNYGDFTQLNGRAPTFVENRCAMYLAIIHGARAFSLFKYGDSSWAQGDAVAKRGGVYYPDLRVGMPPLIKEIKALAEPLLTGKTLPAKASDANIHLLLKKLGNDYTLFACNVTDKPVSAVIDVLPEMTELSVVSEGRKIKAAGGKLTDEFKPYDTHIYTTGSAVSGTTIEQIKADILKAGGVFEFSYK